MKTIDLNVKNGESVLIKNKDASLAVKVIDGKIIPDFVNSVMLVIESNHAAFNWVESDYYHKVPGAREQLLSLLAKQRDKIFDAVPSVEEADTPATEASEDAVDTEKAAGNNTPKKKSNKTTTK